MKGRIGEIAKEMWVYLRFLNTFLIILLLGSLSWAQNVIFPGIYGEALLDSLVNDYKPNTVLSYAGARDFMFGTLDNENDSVTCVYTGFMVYIDPNSSDPPRTVAFNAGLNTEHTWPQSLGSSGDARANLHHLFPTRIDVNNARANYPF
ncbi:MAG: hypothetical protein GWN00_34510, partial [Aliifodinibius sp.]|nr:hypothetical protein [candidate division Zixibacteria bacterium]NIT61136.1 hypothetical protein [Fodinibius sp.]NIS48592.1 hypothetical protein [candidate division Zixibacteria bacterium]NIU13127.1 hypothetical protein [candidate division Zixibacteria bacterium]NIV08831.1 hypothetical protein [candidate division Zixibacteria bacterium]